MKPIIALICLFAFSAFAEKFKATCPKCGELETLTPRNIRTNGGYSSVSLPVANSDDSIKVLRAVPGFFLERSATFKCNRKGCKAKWTMRIKPDIFVAEQVAESVSEPPGIVPIKEKVKLESPKRP